MQHNKNQEYKKKAGANTGEAHGSFQNPPEPHWCSTLMVGVCLVLVPAEDLSLNPCQQGYPCRWSIFC